MKTGKVCLQGITEYNPKTHDYLVKIGSLKFPFKSINEVHSYFLGKFTLTRKLKSQKNSNTVSNYSFFIILSNSILYLTSYCKKLLIRFNCFREVLH